jgi:hypothetical protein
MRDEIEALDRAAKHLGSLRDPVHREADRQVGWAYRLLHAYGTKEEVSFDEGSEAREALIEAGAEPYEIPFIAATYQAERREALAGSSGMSSTAWRRSVSMTPSSIGRPRRRRSIGRARRQTHALIEWFGVEAGKRLNSGCACFYSVSCGSPEDSPPNASPGSFGLDGKPASVG